MLVSLEASNFLSFKKLEFEFKNNITRIDGFNHDDDTAEGSGKTSILNALCFAIYGRTPKDVKTDELIHNGEKSCEVHLNIEHAKYKRISRTRGPNKLFLVDNAETIITGKDAKETQKMIEDVIGISFDAFCQSIYFAQGYDKSFLDAAQSSRGIILSEILDLSQFDRAYKATHELKKDAEKTQDSLKTQMLLMEKDIETFDFKINLLEKRKNEIIKQNEDTKASLLDNITHLKEQIKTETLNHTTNYNKIEKAIEVKKASIQESSNAIESKKASLEVLKAAAKTKLELDTLQAQINELESQKLDINQVIKNARNLLNEKATHEKRIKFLTNEQEKISKQCVELIKFLENPSNICPTCGTNLGKLDTSHAEQELMVLNDKFDAMTTEIEQETLELQNITNCDTTELELQINTINVEITKKKTEISQNDQVLSKIKMSEYALDLDFKQIDKITNEVIALEKELAEYPALDLTNIKNRLIAKEIELSNLKSVTFEKEEAEIADLNSNKLIQKAQLVSINDLLLDKVKYVNDLEILKDSFKECKNFIFNVAIQELNSKVNFYLEKLFEVSANIEFTNVDMEISQNITLDGKERSLGLLSGGQNRRFKLATNLAFRDLVHNRSGCQINLLITDEGFKDLSEASMKKCVDLLQDLKLPIILIEHNSILKTIVDEVVFVDYKNGVSTIKE